MLVRLYVYTTTFYFVSIMNLFFHVILFLCCISSSIYTQESKKTSEESHCRILKDMYQHALDVLKTESHGPLCSQLTNALQKAYGWTCIIPMQKPTNFSSLIRAAEKIIHQYKVLIPKQVLATINQLNALAKNKKNQTKKIAAGVISGTAAMLALTALYMRTRPLKKHIGASSDSQSSSALSQKPKAPQTQPTTTPHPPLYRIPEHVKPVQHAPVMETYDDPNSTYVTNAPSRLVPMDSKTAPRDKLNTGVALCNSRRSTDIPSWIHEETLRKKTDDAHRFYSEVSLSNIRSCINSTNSNQPNKQGSTPLITIIEDIRLLFKQKKAIKNEEAKQIILYLIESGAEVNHQNNFGLSALHYACWYQQFFIMETLLKSGANPNLESFNNHFYPLDLLLIQAAKDQKFEGEDYLGWIDRLCNIMSPESKQCTSHSLFISALFFSDAFKSIKILCDHKFDFNKVDPISGSSPLEYAIAEKRKKAIKFFIKNDALIDEKTITLFNEKFLRTDFYKKWYNNLIKLPRAHAVTVTIESPVVVYTNDPPATQPVLPEPPAPTLPTRPPNLSQNLSAKETLLLGLRSIVSDLESAKKFALHSLLKRPKITSST